ncbi:catalase [Rubripirellula amarantea]|uniref:Catalase n=1 Tax=Rubripirellula amarantea TaxID=2527999 RepID=A0A5C5WUQ9_9BACT|nr:catalase [Rubripirellula amarantea]MDA8744308.1 catalase [Rubripirellula amarantea]TWT53831.1 Catalase C [Rubripirellula amarantea]
MAKKKKPDAKQTIGNGGELHQTAGAEDQRLTTNQGVVVSDDQNTLTVGPRGPQLLEDFVMREKITHFDHERIPERVVHARGYAAHGYFQAYKGNSKLTKAAFLQDPSEKTPVFCRFSTVAGSAGSPDTARDVRGFSVKFYTSAGNYDLVGNNIPVFFIQDAIKFPDLIHSVKPEPDRDFPQAQSAHNTFWDFVSLNPESVHMLMWIMSDRAIPRSFRMMEGFGVHTFRMINEKGESRFVKFHWRPKLGTFSLIWPEAVKISGADPDFHRRDLWNAIESGDYPEWELCVQAFTEEEANKFDYDVLDPTKLVPEEQIPLTPIGKMVLDRNVDNFFAETEQVAFCPSHVVPGIDFSNDPLLQGRLFSYLDTQLSRLGSPNFHQIPVNKPKCPFANFQRDGHMQMEVPTGNVANEPNSLDSGSPRECPITGFGSFPAKESGEKLRIRPESFADHYTQARLFWVSMTEPEKRHIVGGFAFELGKCDELKIRKRMLGHLSNVDQELCERVASALGMEGEADSIKPLVSVGNPEPSPALSQYTDAPKTLAGKKIGVLTTNLLDSSLYNALEKAAKKEGAMMEIVALKAGPIKTTGGKEITPDHFLSGAPSVLFDCVVIAPGKDQLDALMSQAAAVDWIRDAFGHLKVIGFTDQAMPMFEKASVDTDSDEGVVNITSTDVASFIDAAKQYRIWDREPKVRS